MKGTRSYRNREADTHIHVTVYAERLMGSGRVPRLVLGLSELMRLMGAKRAYVSKCGGSLEIHIISPAFGTNVLRIEP